MGTPLNVSDTISLGHSKTKDTFSANLNFLILTFSSTTASRPLPGQSGATSTPSALSLSAFLTTLDSKPTGGWKNPLPFFHKTLNASTPWVSPEENLA